MQFESVAPRTAYQAAAEQLRGAILANELVPGQNLPSERDLSEQLGVGRSTVREALRQLHAEGLVEAPGRTSPMRVADPGSKLCDLIVHVARVRHLSLDELVHVRRAIESRALELAAEAPDPERLVRARQAIAVMEDPGVSALAFHDADVAFHLSLAEASGNPLLVLLLRGVRAGMRETLLAISAKRLESARARLVQEHSRLLGSVERGEVERVADLLADHLEGFYGS